jgi:hypothetical protein
MLRSCRLQLRACWLQPPRGIWAQTWRIRDFSAWNRRSVKLDGELAQIQRLKELQLRVVALVGTVTLCHDCDAHVAAAVAASAVVAAVV